MASIAWINEQKACVKTIHRPNAALQVEMQHVHLLTVDSYNEDRRQYNIDMLTHEYAESMDVMLSLSELAEHFKTSF